jgi:hypothetical protein
LAEQGHVKAQAKLLTMYSDGDGAPQDYDQAVIWGRKAAEQGQTNAQVILGTMYYDDTGVSQDYITAHKLLNLADQGNSVAVKERAKASKKMT